MSSISTLFSGIGAGLWYSRSHLFNSYCVVPFGIVVLFTILYGLNQLIANVIKIKFPASVLGMLINLIFLCLVNFLATTQIKSSDNSRLNSGAAWVLEHYLRLIKPSMNFSLKWINVFFIPSFIILPLSEHITFIECLKIAAVFVIGFIVLMLIDVYFILSLKWLLIHFNLFTEETHKEEEEREEEEIELLSLDSRSKEPDTHPVGSGRAFTSMRDDITTIDNFTINSETSKIHKSRTFSVSENPFVPQESTSAIPPVNVPDLEKPAPTYNRNSFSYEDVERGIIYNIKTHQPTSSGTVSPESEPETPEVSTSNPYTEEEKENQQVVLFITKYIDWILYLFLFVVSLPFYYISSIHTFLPYHLGLTVLAYYAALLIPQRWPASKRFAHPILISTAEILFVCFIGSLIFHKGKPKGFLEDLKFYKTGKNYLNLFNNKILLNNGVDHAIPPGDYSATPKWPGCGDVLSSLMDISIVSLSLPMFTHRKDFVRNFWVLMPPIIVSIGLTFFLYPIVCHAIGIAPARSIGFIGRSVTLALGTPLINNLEGSVSLMAVCTILSGICGVLVGDHIFTLLRVAKNDYVTRGVSLGINCGAIATAHLLNVDPRAASMSSLSFSTFGTVMIILASIGVIRDEIRSLVGL